MPLMLFWLQGVHDLRMQLFPCILLYNRLARPSVVIGGPALRSSNVLRMRCACRRNDTYDFF